MELSWGFLGGHAEPLEALAQRAFVKRLLPPGQVASRILQIKHLVLTIQDDEKAVQHITSHQDIDTISGNAAHAGKVKTFYSQSDIEHRPASVRPVKAASPNVAARRQAELRHQSFGNRRGISAAIQFAPQRATPQTPDGVRDYHVRYRRRRLEAGVIKWHS
jgi:hypothetical protein